MTPDTLLSVKGVAARTSFHPIHVWRLVRQGKFPPPTHIGKAARWSLLEIAEWIEARKAERGQERRAS